MYLSLNTEELFNCLEVVEKALPVRTTMPLTGNILCVISKNNITFSATNHEIYIKTTMNHSGSESGRILLPPKFVEVMRYFPTKEVEINIDWEKHRIDMQGGSANFHLYGANPDEYPLFFEERAVDSEEYSLDKNLFKNTLRSVVFAASTEETRPAFNGVLFSFNGNTLTLIASDTYRLVTKEIVNQNWSFTEKNILVPAKSLRELMRIAGDSNNEIFFYRQENILSFSFDDILFSTRLLEEKYPDVRGVIPGEYKTRIELDRKALEDTVSRAALLAEGKNQAVNFSVIGNNLEIRVNSQDGSMEEILPAVKEGDDLSLYVNTRFILDILKVLSDEKIIIDFHGEGGPLIFRLPDNSGFLYLVLPIKRVS